MDRDGFALLAMGFTGSKALRFKLAYIAEFNCMEEELRASAALPFLAGEINDAHGQVTSHGKGMLMEAKRAGEALMAAKSRVRHGEFKAWIEANCRCSYRSAAEYMQVARLTEDADIRTFDGGIRAFLEAHTTPRKAAPLPASSFDKTDAEYVLKLARMADSGNQNEAAVARRKLDDYAARSFGMTGAEARAKAEKLLPSVLPGVEKGN